MGLKQVGADRCFKNGLLNGNHWAGLMSSATAELTGNGYARVALTLASWQRDGSTRRYENNGDIIFPVPTPQAWLIVTHIGLWSTATGGNPFVTIDITDTDAPQIGAQVRWVDEMVKFGAQNNGITVDGSIAMLNEGLVSGTRFISFHTAAPSSSNRIGNSVSVAAANFTANTSQAGRRGVRNNARIATNVFTTDVGTPTHVALRDGSAANAAILWAQTAGGNPSDPVIGDLSSIAANAMQVELSVDT